MTTITLKLINQDPPLTSPYSLVVHVFYKYEEDYQVKQGISTYTIKYELHDTEATYEIDNPNIKISNLKIDMHKHGYNHIYYVDFSDSYRNKNKEINIYVKKGLKHPAIKVNEYLSYVHYKDCILL